MLGRILLSNRYTTVYHKPRAYGPSVSYMAVEKFKQLLNLSVYYTTKTQRGLNTSNLIPAPSTLSSIKVWAFSSNLRNFVGLSYKRSGVLRPVVRCSTAGMQMIRLERGISFPKEARALASAQIR